MKDLICPFCETKIVENLGYITPENGGKIYVAEDCKSSTEYYCSIEQIRCINNHLFFISIDD